MAAGVTGRLWEMGDVVDVLDALEAKRKRAVKADFEVERWKIGGGFYARATLADGTIDRIEGFATEGDAGRWIKNESVVWLHERRQVKSAVINRAGYLLLCCVQLIMSRNRSNFNFN